ncbi:MAG: NADH:flavin oxidoreductase/NADH oxidase [Quisquiliibacterium sp.]
MTTHLFSPIRLRSFDLPNRIIVAPMCQYSAVDGKANNWHTVHLGQLALSGAGMLIVEATAVEPIGRITPGCLGLYDDDTEQALGWTLDAVREVSPIRMCLQIAHAGRKASSGRPWDGGQLIPASAGGWQPAGPSAVPHLESEAPPREMSLEDLQALTQRFVEATERANRLGFDAIEVHSAHGYLLHQFLSPISNHRTDQYGGSLENRMRFPLEVFTAMRAAWPAHKPMGIRISCSDWVEGGWDIDGTIAFAKRCETLGADWIDASSGGVSPKQKIILGPGYQVHFAEAIRKAVKIPVMAVGLITEPAQAEEILSSGKADMIALARGMLYNPRWAWHAAAELGASIEAPRQYWRSQPSTQKALFGKTSFGAR